MAEEFEWSETEKDKLKQEAKCILDVDFVGPSANKLNARMRAATRADIQAAFVAEGVPVTSEVFVASQAFVARVANHLGFQLSDAECESAVADLLKIEAARKRTGSQMAGDEVSIRTFAQWWNSEANNPALARLQDDTYAREAFAACAEKANSKDRKLTVLRSPAAKSQAIQELSLLTTGCELGESELRETVIDLERAAVEGGAVAEAAEVGSNLGDQLKSVVVSETVFVKWATSIRANSHRSSVLHQQANFAHIGDTSGGQDSKQH